MYRYFFAKTSFQCNFFRLEAQNSFVNTLVVLFSLNKKNTLCVRDGAFEKEYQSIFFDTYFTKNTRMKNASEFESKRKSQY